MFREFFKFFIIVTSILTSPITFSQCDLDMQPPIIIPGSCAVEENTTIGVFENGGCSYIHYGADWTPDAFDFCDAQLRQTLEINYSGEIETTTLDGTMFNTWSNPNTVTWRFYDDYNNVISYTFYVQVMESFSCWPWPESNYCLNQTGTQLPWCGNGSWYDQNGNQVNDVNTTTPGTYNYSWVSWCSGISQPFFFEVSNSPVNTVSAASSSPTLCVNTVLTNITHSTTGSTGIGAATGLPIGVTATWESNTITISGTPIAAGTYSYSIPLTGGCGTVNATGTITVNFITPTFTQVGPYTSGASIPALPTTSINGFTGTWSPGINNTATTTYTFTPTAGQCATTTTMAITINDPLQYTVTASDNSVCAGTTVTLSVNIVDQNSTNATCGAPDIHNPNLSYGTVVDQDGNSYKTIVIGNQTWMAENLKSSTYVNGDVINNVTDHTQWANLTTGACSYYNNNYQNECPYGKLYNWYAVSDTRKICPAGWHVPSDVEWTVLTDYLGGTSVAGEKMKSSGAQYWQSPNTFANNLSGFSGLPGGYRGGNGTYSNFVVNGFWWSSTDQLTIAAWIRQLGYDNSNVTRNLNGPKGLGYSVRCIKD
jgi:uncharacterized protein (TIGR02145 family)